MRPEWRSSKGKLVECMIVIIMSGCRYGEFGKVCQERFSASLELLMMPLTVLEMDVRSR